MKNTPFLLLFLGIAFIWLGLTGRLAAVLAAIFEPGKLIASGSYSPPAWSDGGKGQPPPESPAVGGGGYQTPPPGMGSLIQGGAM